MTWSEMNTRQRAACLALPVPALVAYGIWWLVVRGCDAVGLE